MAKIVLDKKTYPATFIGIETTYPNGKERTCGVFRFDSEIVKYGIFGRDIKDEISFLEKYKQCILHLEETMGYGFHGFSLVGVEAVEGDGK